MCHGIRHYGQEGSALKLKMASQQKDSRFPCPMCFETRALKIVGRCHHSFCSECLSSVLEALDTSKDVFPCPSCQRDCPRPWDGVKGLVDFTGDVQDVETNPSEKTSTSREKPEGNKHDKEEDRDIICDICDHKKKRAKAANCCNECNLNICKDCSKRHNKSKATSDHMLTPIVSERQVKESMCNEHHKLLIRFCTTCGVPACNICVCVDHEDHNVEKLADTIRSKVEGVKVILETRQEKLKELQQLEKKLTLLKSMVPMVDRQEILIKEIEDHAKKCIDEIIKWKEDLKAQVRLDNKIATDIPADLEKVTETVLKLHDVVSRANSLLPNTEHHPEYLNKIESIQEELTAIPGAGAEVEERQHRDMLRKVYQEDHTFRAIQIPVNYGRVDKKRSRGSEKNFEVKSIFKATLPVDSQDAYILCVTAIGEKSYAVAHPTRKKDPAKAINIYEYPGILTHILSENVPPFRDMAATPDGKLALLSHQEDGTMGRINVFDPLTGEVGSTYDIPTTRTLSFCVTLRYQYVILGDDDQGQTQIIVMDKNGHQQHKHEIIKQQFWYERLYNEEESNNTAIEERMVGEEDPHTAQVQGEEQVHQEEQLCSIVGVEEMKPDTVQAQQESDRDYAEPNIIACGGRFIFIQGGHNVAVYAIRDTGVHRITIGTELAFGAVTAVTASIWDDLFLVDVCYEAENDDSTEGLFLDRYKFEVGWADFKYTRVLDKPSECNQKSKVSTIGGNIVVLSHGHTFKVYKVKL